MKNKVYFFLLFLGTVAVAVFSGSEFARFLLGFEFLLAIALFAIARLLKRQVDMELSPPAPEGHRGEDIPIEVRLENSGGLPVPEARVELRCRDEYDGTVFPLQGTAMLDGKDKTALRFTLQAKHYGLLTLWGEKVRVGDPLGVYFPTLRFPERKWQIAVLPELKKAPSEQNVEGKAQITAEDGANSGSGGNDPSAAYELRKYQNGEPLRNIHWKMTAKTDEFMVKEYGRDVERMTAVILDLSYGAEAYHRADWDRFLETVASFATGQLEAERGFLLLWQDAQGQLYQAQVHDGPSARAALTALLGRKPYPGTGGHNAYKEILRNETYDGTIRIDLWGRITREEVL